MRGRGRPSPLIRPFNPLQNAPEPLQKRAESRGRTTTPPEATPALKPVLDAMWTKPTLENLRANLSEIETQAFGQEDLDDAPLLQQLKDTVSSVRGFVRSGRKCRMPSDEELIPDFLISPAMDIAVFNLLKRHRVPANESRTKAYDRACALLEKVGVGQIVPEDYGENAAEVSPDNQTPLPAFRRRKRVLGRSQEEGL